MYGMSGSAPPENIRDVTYDEDSSQIRTGNALRIMATLRNLPIGILKLTGADKIAVGCRHNVA
jgi:hypothetical protein